MKIICIGRNYAKHIEELASERPDNPVVFLKPDSAILLKKNPLKSAQLLGSKGFSRSDDYH